MPAKLVPNEDVPGLAAKISAPALQVLRRLKQDWFILNDSNVDQETAAILQQLVTLGLVDPAYAGPTDGPPFQWVSNSNGERVLKYVTGIRAGPHYEISSSDLAAWLEQQGVDRWWTVDGDPLLMGRLNFPCPADELAAELRKINKPLLLAEPEHVASAQAMEAKGQIISASDLDHVVQRVHVETESSRIQDARWLYLCWKGSTAEWKLVEDVLTTESNRRDELELQRERR